MEYIPAKTIITRNKSTAWFGADYNSNIYRGCCHGCIYCDSRSDCYNTGGYATDNFDSVRAKENALTLIRDELRRKVKKGVVATGSMSDPYNPFEREELLTRHALELFSAYGFGAAIATKSALVTRDIDVLSEIKSHSPVLVKLTITADDELSSVIEPEAPSPGRRFDALCELSQNGIFCGVLLMPVLPFINDTKENILGIVRNAAKNGARFVYPAFGVTLRANQRQYFYDRLDERFPGIKDKYLKAYGERYSCASPHARQLYKLFAEECDRLGLLYDMRSIIRSYKQGYAYEQLSLF